VMEEMGVSTQLLAAGDIYPALELGTIDATEFSMPAIDLGLGFYQVAEHYYLPGWHQQSTMFDLMLNLDKWNELDDTQKAQIESVCMSNMAYGLAEGEFLQVGALQELEEKGVNIHRWSPEILEQLESAWQKVVQVQVEGDEDFARAWESLSTFREAYQRWGQIGYLD